MSIVDESIPPEVFGQWVTNESRGENLSKNQYAALNADPVRWDCHLGAICRDINLQMENCTDPDALARMRKAQWAYIKRKADVKVLVRQLGQSRSLAELHKKYDAALSLIDSVGELIDDNDLSDEEVLNQISVLVDDWQELRRQAAERRESFQEIS